GDDAVTVRIRVVAGGHVELVPVGNEGGHGVRAGAVHADLAVGIERHETEGGIHMGVDHGEVQAVGLGDGTPVVHGGPAHRVGTDADAGLADGVDVDHIGQVLNVGALEVVAPDALIQYAVDGDTLDVDKPAVEQVVGAVGDPVGRIRVGRPTVGGVVLETTIARRVVGRGDHDAIGQRVGRAGRAPAHILVMAQD